MRVGLVHPATRRVFHLVAAVRHRLYSLIKKRTKFFDKHLITLPHRIHLRCLTITSITESLIVFLITLSLDILSLRGLRAHTRHNSIDTEHESSRLDSSLDGLGLDDVRLPELGLGVVNKLALDTIDTPGETRVRVVIINGVLHTQLGDNADGLGTTVLRESAGNDLESLGSGLEGQLLGTGDVLGGLGKGARESHLSGTTTGENAGVKHDVAHDSHGVLEVTVNLLEHILGGTAEEDGAGLRVLAADDVSEVLITDLLHLEETAASTDIGLLEVAGVVDDSSANGTSDTVVIGLTDTAEHGDVGLAEVVRGKLRDTLLSEDEVGLESNDSVTELLNVLFFLLEDDVPVLFLGDLDVGHRLTLLVLKVGVEEDDTGILDTTTHLSIDDILVEHDTIEHARVFNIVTRDLLDTSVTLDIDLTLATLVDDGDALDGIDGEVGDEVTETRGELGTESGVDDLEHKVSVGHIERDGVLLQHLESLIEGLVVSLDDNARVHVLHDERLGVAEELGSEKDDRGSTITDLFVLSTGQLDHVLSGRVRHINLRERREV